MPRRSQDPTLTSTILYENGKWNLVKVKVIKMWNMKAGLGFARMNSEMTDAQKINTQQQWNVKARKVKEMKMRNHLLYQNKDLLNVLLFVTSQEASLVVLRYYIAYYTLLTSWNSIKCLTFLLKMFDMQENASNSFAKWSFLKTLVIWRQFDVYNVSFSDYLFTTATLKLCWVEWHLLKAVMTDFEYCIRLRCCSKWQILF